MGQHHAAMLCLATGRPVMLRFDRKISLRMHAKRHPIVMDYELGCDKDGRLVALVAHMHSDTGAYASVGMKVIERAVAHSAGAYSHPQRAREGHRGDHQQRLLRRHARVRRQPGLLRHRVQRGRAVRHGRLRPLAVPLGQRPGGRQGHRHRPGAEERRGRARLPGGPQGPVPEPPSTPASPPASRTPASAAACPTSAGPRSASRGRTRWCCTTAGARWARAPTTWPCRPWSPRPASTRPSSRCGWRPTRRPPAA